MSGPPVKMFVYRFAYQVNAILDPSTARNYCSPETTMMLFAFAMTGAAGSVAASIDCH